MDSSFSSYKIQDRSYVSFIKREIHNKVSALHFSGKQVAEIDIILSEITSNLIKHAQRGELLYKISSNEKTSTFDVICIDNGPGMQDSLSMMKDGVSTTGTLGQGLGALKRLSTLFHLYSIPGWGTVLYSSLSSHNPALPHDKARMDLDVKAVCISKPPEVVCGDGCRVRQINNGVQILFADGLGHGPHAKEAVDKAGDFFLSCDDIEPVAIIRQMHDVVRNTRGLVLSLASFERDTREWKICGVGNILTKFHSGITNKIYFPYNGAVGLTIPNSMKASTFPIEKNQHLIMCSDGIKTRWELTKYPAILRNHSLILAAALYKDFSRGTDDASVLVAKVT